MMTVKRSAGAAPDVNLKNPFHAGSEVCKGGIHPDFETEGRHHKKSKTGVSVVLQKALITLPKIKRNML